MKTILLLACLFIIQTSYPQTSEIKLIDSICSKKDNFNNYKRAQLSDTLILCCGDTLVDNYDFFFLEKNNLDKGVWTIIYNLSENTPQLHLVSKKSQKIEYYYTKNRLVKARLTQVNKGNIITVTNYYFIKNKVFQEGIEIKKTDVPFSNSLPKMFKSIVH